MERESYILKSININQYNIVLISKDMCRLQEYIKFVEEDLQFLKKETYILFDLLLNNNIDDRYYKCFYDGRKLIRKSLTKVKNNELNNDIISLTSSYYLQHQELFDKLFYTKEYKLSVLNQLEEQI
ncbi:type II toxin-antitoxin system RnlB family antitoxin [Sphingobacterium sp. HJSM2_6]|uniref:type II toxin-antitoxin system RnlB family antitoxin n=1 Tax=Sphingobacterium sp. HJSM2_6 TaxID=3366264 RepID=UPI003BDBB6FD